MPPYVIDIRSADDSRDVVHRAVQALAEGQLVAFPTETVYVVAASARHEAAVARLVKIIGPKPESPLSLAIKNAQQAPDYVPAMSSLARRLARRCWPGPVTLVMDDDHPDSLLRQLPDSVRQALTANGEISLRVPAHTLLLDVLHMLSGPIVVAEAAKPGKKPALSGADVVSSLGGDVQMVLDDGPSRYGQPSSVVKVSDGRFEVLRTGVVAPPTLQRLSSLMILFVCTGNTCRSPMAEAICRHLVAEKLGCPPEALEDHGVIVLSAGIAAMPGGRPAPEAVEVVKEMGLGPALEMHESQPLTDQLLHQADLVLTMTRSHRHSIIKQWPHDAERVHVLCMDQNDVSDPIGGPVEVYRRCAAQIKGELERRIAELDII